MRARPSYPLRLAALLLWVLIRQHRTQSVRRRHELSILAATLCGMVDKKLEQWTGSKNSAM